MKIDCPTYIEIPSKKVSLNINTYRNLHYILESQCKREFKRIIAPQLQGYKFTEPIEITYRLYKPSNRKMDKMNVISIVSKYLLDSMVSFGTIVDDNDNVVKTETILPTLYDKENPRVEVTIKELIL